jgi:hypothetical protein
MKTVTVLRPCYALIAASAFLLAGCGGGDTSAQNASAGPPPAVGAADPSPTAIPCGKVPAVQGAQADVVIRGGTVDCPEATKLLTDYFKQLTPADLASPDGAGPVVLGEWTCGSGAGDPVTSCSTEDSRQVDANVTK